MGVALPLFPLQSIVLFPHMMLPLHIFEPRYISMVEDCLAGDRRFGVTLLRSGQEVGGPAVPHLVGTVARIREHREMEEGRYMLLAFGEHRFRVLSYVDDHGLLRADVEFFDDEPDTQDVDQNLREEVTRLAGEHFRLVRDALGQPVPDPVFPGDPRQLSFALASSLQADAGERQALLELTDTAERLRRVAEGLRASTALLGRRIAIDKEATRICTGNGRLDYDEHLSEEILRSVGR
ncbi:MAG: LON peptidase substrate-binding domain-containing protein [Armatimonadetes bacterium]|nr:LON peptidase substrate-binding domain-containing protein [Armatimonadota bacterium]